jgi:hypothetical protein
VSCLAIALIQVKAATGEAASGSGGKSRTRETGLRPRMRWRTSGCMGDTIPAWVGGRPMPVDKLGLDPGAEPFG